MIGRSGKNCDRRAELKRACGAMQTSLFPSYKSAEPGDNQYYINMTIMYMPTLQEKMDVRSVIPYLAKDGLLKLDGKCMIWG